MVGSGLSDRSDWRFGADGERSMTVPQARCNENAKGLEERSPTKAHKQVGCARSARFTHRRNLPLAFWASSLPLSAARPLRGSELDDDQKQLEVDKLKRSEILENQKNIWNLGKLAIEQAYDARKHFSDQIQELRIEMLRNVNTWGQLCLRSGLILNRGAVVAVLTLLGTAFKAGATDAFNPEKFGTALVSYAFGLLAIGVSMFFAYLNWHSNTRLPTYH